MLTTAYISHGGGPLPLLGDSQHNEMVSVLKRLSHDIATPDLIIVISAHWESPFISIQSNDMPAIYYDYYGFPEEAYRITYPARGNSKLADYLNNVINEHGIASHLDNERGYDHGMFVPLSIMYPNADIPCIQVSLKNTLDPNLHIKLGKALRHALKFNGVENILLLGSGSSFHNMTAFFQKDEQSYEQAYQFDEWLQKTMCTSETNEIDRKQALVSWKNAPQATFAHPREEHLLPLHVCYGANERAADQYYGLTLLGKPASMFVWSD